ncbi:hypothetical protein PIB30_073527 [Stylosanthes scabra]|uniref:Uncharacterized protein n=1 Tax=Stylosanthes scabra TaxID=79078 RepID=A0ABU6QQ23_9FABA|nr:hypothetical protein [Stylosanthes scabra]
MFSVDELEQIQGSFGLTFCVRFRHWTCDCVYGPPLILASSIEIQEHIQARWINWDRLLKSILPLYTMILNERKADNGNTSASGLHLTNVRHPRGAQPPPPDRQEIRGPNELQ